MVRIWETSILTAWGVIQLREVIKNMHRWAAEDLRSIIWTYLRRWKEDHMRNNSLFSQILSPSASASSFPAKPKTPEHVTKNGERKRVNEVTLVRPTVCKMSQQLIPTSSNGSPFVKDEHSVYRTTSLPAKQGRNNSSRDVKLIDSNHDGDRISTHGQRNAFAMCPTNNLSQLSDPFQSSSRFAENSHYIRTSTWFTDLAARRKQVLREINGAYFW
ncbi:uncharacterized protein PV09_02520 [Verruconis gallopava]|uniref:Uncharacterized protein n=1 Tax=Verruconis gallopava TaxID=253628 RepID=A0A0D2AJU1_9PEZI|nr:uncharacterized protein PV09_02520 [Verruconis gallopava]KIW06840.1 hypothetical protein PV09_02520 [Verruconis gallopava]